MNTNKLQQIKTKLESMENDILGTKGNEYVVSNEDRLKFFKDYGTQLGINPKIVCSIFLMKHINSILNYVKTGYTGIEGIIGRINDARNYLLFLAALKEEEDIEKYCINQFNDEDDYVNLKVDVNPSSVFVHSKEEISTNTSAGSSTEDEVRSQEYEDKCRWELNADAPVYEDTEIIDGDD